MRPKTLSLYRQLPENVLRNKRKLDNMSKKIQSQILKRFRPPIGKDFRESQFSSWTRIKDFIVTFGAASGVLAGVLWMGGRFYAYGYFERIHIPLYFLSFSAGEYAETYVTSIFANIITYMIANFWQILIVIILVIAVSLVLSVIQSRFKKLKIHEAVITIDNIGHRLLAISFVMLLFLSFFIAYNNGNAAASHTLANGQSVTVYSTELLPLGSPSTLKTPVQNSSLYAFTDLYLLTYNNGKYYFFTELDLVTCKPKQVYVVPDSSVAGVKINESSLAFPKCAISPVK